MAPSRINACNSRSVLRLRAISRQPLVSRSSRCTSSSASRGRSARSASMTPRLRPLPPWTAMPAGLSSAMRFLSSNTIAWRNCSRIGRGGAICDADSRRTGGRSEEHTSELQSHRDLHSFPTRRSSDLERDEILVLEYDRLAQLLAHRPGRRDLRRGLEAHWRDPDTVACLEAMFRLDAAAAYPDLAFA